MGRSGRKLRVRSFAGDYRDAIRFESRVAVGDEGGGRAESWATEIDEVGANCDPYAIEELLQTGQTKPITGFNIICRWFDENNTVSGKKPNTSWRIYSYADDIFIAVTSMIDIGSRKREYAIKGIKTAGVS